MFEGEAYAPYIALCRELHLPWRWTPGDYFTPDGGSLAGNVYIVRHEEHLPDEDNFQHGVKPLPRLDQWLAMLEEAAITEVDIHGERDRYVAMDGASLHYDDAPLKQGIGRSREEAAARLWMAVTGRMA